MELKLKIQVKNSFPKEGIFIKGSLISFWLQEIQNMGLSLDAVKVFPVPGTTANELYGCIVFLNSTNAAVKDIGKNNFCQLIENKLFIPENTTVFPALAKEEWNNLFSENYHFLHPEIGFVALEDEVIWSNLIKKPNFSTVEILEPNKGISIPKSIVSLRIEVDKEELLKEIENPFSEEEMNEKLPFDLKKLMNGNNKEIDKFLAYLAKNPEKAMKLAIPLDTIGSGRGGNEGVFRFNSGFGSDSSYSDTDKGIFKYGFILVFVLFARSSIRSVLDSNSSGVYLFILIAVLIGVFVLFMRMNKSNSPSTGTGGAAIVDSDRFTTLQNTYEKLAEDFVSRNEYEKAAHVYLKLLKNNHKAAATLENGKLYREAGAVYLKYLQNKSKAAECYEKGHAYGEAIVLYKEVNEYEKVGDLYTILNNKPEADKNYYSVVENYKSNFQYVKAALVCKKKIENVKEAQDLLIEGWRTDKDAYNCLNNYFANISLEELPDALTDIYKNEMKTSNKEKFLDLLKHEYEKDKTMEDLTRNIAFEIVADRIDKNPEIASRLIYFNKKNTSMTKDIMKFKLKKRNSPKD
ncbi:hypothetical protein GKZ90_0002345 [Flavobacterium sp. MC2016-06]|uniref:hypothetical protein n=1 Tax=Flavobacterium sp. MC2016-06 TaxID=2676308 RepID=UPI0012BB0815|nr:hypothetical protein [Flavobacterium sp. MC2016-06]MBU3858282.1 hypothetical protein [Flavobacterium sp. MC2016-06]